MAGAAGRDPGRLDAILAAALLASLGARALTPERLTAWWRAHASPPPARRRHGRAAGEGADLPPLLEAAGLARTWVETGPIDHKTPLQALLLGAATLTRRGAAQCVVAPVWAAYPAVGFGDRDALPTLRSDAARRLLGPDRRVSWDIAFLHLVAESARMGLRELARLRDVAEQGRGLTEGVDRRSRLPDAFEQLLRCSALTPKVLAARLRIAPQTATALLRELQGRGVAREITGRGSFRAFAV